MDTRRIHPSRPCHDPLAAALGPAVMLAALLTAGPALANTPPVATDRSYVVLEDELLTVAAPGLLEA